jgi:hypothetical protein
MVDWKNIPILTSMMSGILAEYDGTTLTLELVQNFSADTYEKLCSELTKAFGADDVKYDIPRIIRNRTPRNQTAAEVRKQNVKLAYEHRNNIEKARKFGFDIGVLVPFELPRSVDYHFYINITTLVVGCKILVHAPLQSETYNTLYVAGVFDSMYAERAIQNADKGDLCEACGKECTARFCEKCAEIIERLCPVSVHLSECVRAPSRLYTDDACLVSTCSDHKNVESLRSPLRHAKSAACSTFTGPVSVGGLMTCHKLTCIHEDGDRTFNPKVCDAAYAWEDVREIDGGIALEYDINTPPWAKRVTTLTIDDGKVLCRLSRLVFGEVRWCGHKTIYIRNSSVCQNMACVSHTHMSGSRLMSEFCRSAAVIKRFAPKRENAECHDLPCQQHAESNKASADCDPEYVW